jgi:hypothetical protein
VSPSVRAVLRHGAGVLASTAARAAAARPRALHLDAVRSSSVSTSPGSSIIQANTCFASGPGSRLAATRSRKPRSRAGGTRAAHSATASRAPSARAAPRS